MSFFKKNNTIENPEEYFYGNEGGSNYLQNYLKINENQKEELRSVREFIHASFEELSCFLLPHPGNIVAGAKKYKNISYDGRHAGMDDEFKNELIILIDQLLKPINLVTKKVDNQIFDGAGFFEYVKNVFKIFQSEKLPKAQTIYESTVERQITNLVNLCLSDYEIAVKEDLHTVTNLSMIEIVHKKCKAQAILKFNETMKMGNDEIHLKFKNILEDKINKYFNFWKSQKENFIKEMEEIQECQESLDVEKLATLEFEKQLAQIQLEVNRMRSENELNHEELEKKKEIEKSRKIANIRRREHEEALRIERRNARLKIAQIKLEADVEKRSLEHQEQRRNIIFYKCDDCGKIIEKSDLYKYSSIDHDFRFYGRDSQCCLL